MSEKLLEEFNAKLTNESVKKLNSDAFVRLQKLKSIPFKELPRDARYSQQLKVLSSALEYSLLTEDRKEQVEYTRFVSIYDPIMWDLLLEHSPMDSTLYPDLLRKCILTLQVNRREIEAEYDSILLPYRWGGKLKPQHLKYQKFVGDHHSRNSLLAGVLFTVAVSALALGVVNGLK